VPSTVLRPPVAGRAPSPCCVRRSLLIAPPARNRRPRGRADLAARRLAGGFAARQTARYAGPRRRLRNLPNRYFFALPQLLRHWFGSSPCRPG